MRQKVGQRRTPQRDMESMADAVRRLVERLPLDNVEVLTDKSGLKGRKARAKGFYDLRTGKITIVLPNNKSVGDVVKTLLHEAVAHHGLRRLFGEHFDAFLDNVYQNASEEVRRRIVELAKKHAIAEQLTQVIPIDLLEGGGGFGAFIPSFSKPIVEAYVLNKD